MSAPGDLLWFSGTTCLWSLDGISMIRVLQRGELLVVLEEGERSFREIVIVLAGDGRVGFVWRRRTKEFCSRPDDESER